MINLLKFFKKSPIVPIVRLDGVIGSSGLFGSSGIDDANLRQVLEKAFNVSKAVSVALIINSPGGSPTQSSLIASRIKNLSKENNIPVIAFCEDVAASGGYWLACCADEIYADENSIIGSIGVISAGFGFNEFISRQGIERRIYTAGKSKSTLDPFLPSKPDDIKRIKKIQEAIHENFKNQVLTNRNGKIKNTEVFNGEFWNASKALELGLIDSIGHLEPTLKEKFGENVKIKFFSKKKSFFSRFTKSSVDIIYHRIVNKILLSHFGL